MDALSRYREMRDFRQTSEPEGGASAEGLALRYGVQLHDATRKHFDLRLEWQGVLLSWAVTRGPSFDPGEKRLAVRTEDHPMDYLSFEGTIPAGNYGGGTVMLWDLGHWQPLDPVGRGLAKGHLRFNLHGVRLTGCWDLVRMKTGEKRENWLLIKTEDEAAGRRDPVARYVRSVKTNRTLREIAAKAPPVPGPQDGARPKFRAPQLATLEDAMPEGKGWQFELKFDGYRGLAAVGAGGPRIYTRSGQDWTDRFADLSPGFSDLDCKSALIDGEIVVGAGLAGFSNLQNAIELGGPFTFYAFDLLELDGKSLTSEPLSTRRKALEKLFKNAPPLGRVQLSPLVEGDPETALSGVCAAGGEGLIAKRLDATYRGERTRNWLKLKCRRRDEFIIIGWQKSDKRNRAFSSLILATWKNGKLTYAGRVGTGYGEDQMADLMAKMSGLKTQVAPADAPRGETRGATWIEPKLVAEVEYAEFTEQGRVRHAVFVGLREDKAARLVEFEGDRAMTSGTAVQGLTITSPDRLVFPERKLTKLDVARYYEQVADRMLPTAADRPLALLRLPEGVEGERFFQKHAGKGFPDEIKVTMITENDGDKSPCMSVSDAAGLVAAAQMGVIEFHIWGSRLDNLERPDRLVFDLDPDEGLGWKDVTSAAIDLRDRLTDLGLPSWALVSGGKGVHVVVPLKRTASWETVKGYSKIFATLMAEDEPTRFVATMSKAKRKGRIFIDWLRNERGSTAIAPFSLRARAEASVAVPVPWDELATLPSARAFSLEAALERGWDNVKVPSPVGLTVKAIARLEAEISGPSSGV